MTRRLLSVLAALAFVTAACAAEPAASTSAPSTAAPPPPEAAPQEEVATPSTLPPPTVLAAPVLPNPLTQRAIDAEMLSHMPMPRLDAPLAGFTASVIREESNETAVDRLPPSYDEREDQVTFGRESGYRSVLRPTRFFGTGTLAADTWVATFTTALGASEYLEDYAKDLAKNGDAGRAPDLVAIEVRTFPVEEVGDEAAGFIIVAEEPSTSSVYQETIVAFRIGRLLAFASLFRDDDLDVRIPALQVAGAFEQRIVSVLDGSFETVEIAPDPQLAAFTFSYRQSLTQRYRYVVVPEGVDDSGGGDGVGDGDGDGETPGTTIPVVWDTETDTTTVRSEGTVIGEDFECSVRITSPAISIRRTYVVAGGLAWVSDRGGAFKEIDRFEEPWAADLVYCPGWSPDRTTSGVRTVTRPGNGVLEPFGEGTAERFELDRDDLIAVGLAGEDGTGISVSWFNIVTAGDGPWVVDLALRLSGTTASLERAVGPGFYPGATVSIDIAFEADDLNSETLSITLP
ncbi:MAG: hypothetical protein QNJ88_01150 [Acidimicrobiia bacterium]|nr:hypothetical protein [Acidimicrobiia bacterium]